MNYIFDYCVSSQDSSMVHIDVRTAPEINMKLKVMAVIREANVTFFSRNGVLSCRNVTFTWR